MVQATRFPLDINAVDGYRESDIDLSNLSEISYGTEGKKGYVDVHLTKAEKLRYAGSYVRREFSNEGDAYRYTMKAMDLKKIGLPITPTVRLLADEYSKPAVLITDLSEGGKYKVWSMNNRVEELDGFRLTPDDLENIGLQLDKIGKLAAENYYYLNTDAYFLVEQESGVPKVYVGDLGIGVVKDDTKPVELAMELNNRSLNRFYDLIEAGTRENQAVETIATM